MQLENDDYWLFQEQHIEGQLVDCAEHGFTVKRALYERGLSDDPRCRVRPAVLEALKAARALLPDGIDLCLAEGFRSWPEQERISNDYKKRLIAAHPDWDAAHIASTVQAMAPLQRIIRRFDKHRYGGAVDIYLIDADCERLDMGCLPGSSEPELCRLYYYECRDSGDDEITYRDNRRMLIRVMENAHFEPYIKEWWHWGFNLDIEC